MALREWPTGPAYSELCADPSHTCLCLHCCRNTRPAFFGMKQCTRPDTLFLCGVPQATGYYRNIETGFYFDANKKLYYHPNTPGTWYEV